MARAKHDPNAYMYTSKGSTTGKTQAAPTKYEYIVIHAKQAVLSPRAKHQS